MPFAPSIAILSLVQATLVALPARRSLPFAVRLQSRWWAVVLPGSLVVVVTGIALVPGLADALTGEAAALALSALACVALGTLIAAVVPIRWLRLAVYAMAIVDACLVTGDLLQSPNAVLNAAAPAASLPQLQFAHFGDAVLGFGDLFVAAVLGAMLASERQLQLRATGLAAFLALAFDLLFFFVSELPATVPIALTLAVL